MQRTFRLAAAALAAFFGLALYAGCDGAIDSVYQEQLAVRAFLYAGQSVDSIVVYRTIPFGEYVSDSTTAVDGATVTLSVDGASYTLLPGTVDGPQRGRYFLPDSVLTILPGKTYSLDVAWNAHRLHGETTVPMPISFVDLDKVLPADRVLTIDTNNFGSFQYILRAGPVDIPSRKYMIQVRALDTTIGRIGTPLNGPPVDTAALIRTTIFPENAPVLPLSVRYFGWQGPNRVTFFALDTNWVDNRRQVFGISQPYQSSLNHIQGGLGVFGSAAVDTVTVYIRVKQ